MGVELYFVKPDLAGRVIPFWDARGESQASPEHRFIASLKWAVASTIIVQSGVGAREAPIPPAQLVEGARTGMKLLLTEVADMHDDFRRLADEAGDDLPALDGLLYAFECEEAWVGGDDASRARASAVMRAEAASLHALLLDMWKAGDQGLYGCWSY